MCDEGCQDFLFEAYNKQLPTKLVLIAQKNAVANVETLKKLNFMNNIEADEAAPEAA